MGYVTKYAYEVTTCTISDSQTCGFEDSLNKRGKDGWALVAIVESHKRHPLYYSELTMYWKREYVVRAEDDMARWGTPDD